MEYSQIMSLVTSLGFPTVVAILLWNKQNKSDEEHKKNIQLKDDENRTFTRVLLDTQKKRIEKLEEVSNDDKKIFNIAVKSFENAVQSFQSVNCNIIGIENKLNIIEKDVSEIKTKIEK